MNTNMGTITITDKSGAVTAACDCDEPKVGVFQKLMESAKGILHIKDSSSNLSDQDTRVAIQSALSDTENFFWIMSVFDHGDGTGMFVFESFESGKLFEQSFSINDDGIVTIGEEKTEVRPVTQFVPVSKELTDAEAGTIQTQENSMKDKDQLVNDLIANEASSFEDGDRDWLSTLEESQLAKMSPVVNEEPAPAPIEEPPVVEEEVVPTPVTTEEYIASAPAEVQAVLNESLGMHRSRKDALVKGILANSRNQFSEPDLQSKGLPELESIAALATNITYEVGSIGQGAPTINDDSIPPPPDLFVLKKDAA